MFGKLNEQEIEEVLRNQIIGRLGCHADDTTYVVPISYAYDGTYIYGHTFEGMKIKLMRKNPQVCFEVDETKDMGNWKSIIAWGEFEELKQGPERIKALQQLTDRVLPIVSSETTHLSPQWPFPAGDTSNIKGIVYRIRLKEKTGRFETNSATSYYA